MFAVVYTRATPSPGHLNYACAYVVGQENTSERGFEWCADTGCNRFITNNIEDFIPASIVDINLTVGVGNGSYCVNKQGIIVFENHLGQMNMRTNALFMPNCAQKLIPGSPFIKKGYTLSILDKQINLRAPNQSILLTGKYINGLYYFKAKIIPKKELLNRPIQKLIDSSERPSPYFKIFWFACRSSHLHRRQF